MFVCLNKCYTIDTPIYVTHASWNQSSCTVRIPIALENCPSDREPAIGAAGATALLGLGFVIEFTCISRKYGTQHVYGDSDECKAIESVSSKNIYGNVDSRRRVEGH